MKSAESDLMSVCVLMHLEKVTYSNTFTLKREDGQQL